MAWVVTLSPSAGGSGAFILGLGRLAVTPLKRAPWFPEARPSSGGSGGFILGFGELGVTPLKHAPWVSTAAPSAWAAGLDDFVLDVGTLT